MNLSEFDFSLPNDLIARFPSEKRGESRLMVVDRQTKRISHHVFAELPSLLPGDSFLVVNRSRVVPAKLFGMIRQSTVEMLMIDQVNDTTVTAFALPAKKFKPGVQIEFDNGIRAEVIEIGEKGKRILKFNRSYSDILEIGYAPLPPYIKRKFDEARAHRKFDLKRYQTLYSNEMGSIAAPTAGLHFSETMLADLKKRMEIIELILHVGTATFQTISADNLADHRMGSEEIWIPEASQAKIKTLSLRNKLTAVGTTSVRSLETFARLVEPCEQFSSEIFIYPGFEFRMVDRLITNFHLPKSSLFVLVSAFGGIELMKEAYRMAVEKKYRFFSYGDAMLIL